MYLIPSDNAIESRTYVQRASNRDLHRWQTAKKPASRWNHFPQATTFKSYPRNFILRRNSARNTIHVQGYKASHTAHSSKLRALSFDLTSLKISKQLISHLRTPPKTHHPIVKFTNEKEKKSLAHLLITRNPETKKKETREEASWTRRTHNRL